MATSTKVGYKEGLIVQQQNARLLIFLLNLNFWSIFLFT